MTQDMYLDLEAPAEQEEEAQPMTWEDLKKKMMPNYDPVFMPQKEKEPVATP